MNFPFIKSLNLKLKPTKDCEFEVLDSLMFQKLKNSLTSLLDWIFSPPCVHVYLLTFGTFSPKHVQNLVFQFISEFLFLYFGYLNAYNSSSLNLCPLQEITSFYYVLYF